MMLDSGGQPDQMNGATPNDARRADDEAVEWVILLREEPDDADTRARFEAWLAASPVNARAWADTAYAYDRAGDTSPAFSPKNPEEARPVLPEGPVPFVAPGAPRARGTAWLLVSRRTFLAVVAAACVAFFAAPAVMLRVKADHVTGAGELREVGLADGSVAQLAPGSAIAVEYGTEQRYIRLLKGEAWFDVQHDPSRPFQVDANGVTTTVLGTAFDVKLDATGATTELARGHVRVEYAGGPSPVSEQLEPGDTLRVTFAGAATRVERPIAQVAAWRDRQIIVQDRPASEVIAALRPWFSGTIIVRGDSFDRQRVTGIYNAADPVDALHGLTRAYGGTVTRITPWVIVLTER